MKLNEHLTNKAEELKGKATPRSTHMNKEQGAAGPGSFMPMVTATAGVGVKRAVSGKAQEELRHMCKGREAQEMNLLEATAPSP